MKRIGILLTTCLISLVSHAQDSIKAEFSVVDVCHGTESVFTNTSKIPSKFGSCDYTWDFGDGSTSTDQFAKHTYTLDDATKAQVFNITLIVQSKAIPSEIDTTYGSTLILPNPNAYFTWKVNNMGNTQDVEIDSQASSDANYFYQWTLASVLKSNDITPVFKHADVKDYLDGVDHSFTLLVRSDLGCENTYTTTFNYNPLAVDDVELVRNLVYPNPSKGVVSLTEKFDNVRFYNLHGELIQEMTDVNQAFTTDLESGIYVLHATLGDQILVQRLVVE